MVLGYNYEPRKRIQIRSKLSKISLEHAENTVTWLTFHMPVLCQADLLFWEELIHSLCWFITFSGLFYRSTFLSFSPYLPSGGFYQSNVYFCSQSLQLPPGLSFLSSVFFFSVTVSCRGCGMTADRRLSLMTYSSSWRRSELFNGPAKWSSVGAERHVRLIRGQDLPLSCAYTKLQCILTSVEEFCAKLSQTATFFSTRTVAEWFFV